MTTSYEIYAITSSDFWYVGSTTKGADNRFKTHCAGKGRAPRLYEKIQELGIAAFTLSILESGSGKSIEAEQYWYDEFLATDPRSTLNGRRPCTYPEITEETRIKMREAKLGTSQSPEQRSKISEALQGNQHTKGHVFSADHRAKLSAAKIGNKYGKGWPKGKPRKEKQI
jgi:hypothetical protein